MTMALSSSPGQTSGPRSCLFSFIKSYFVLSVAIFFGVTLAQAHQAFDPDSLEYLRPEHSEEMEVLLSVYDGDENFKVLDGHTVQYKIGENEDPLSILVEIRWDDNYPESVPSFSLDNYYNQHMPAAAIEEVMNALTEEARKNVGEQQTYNLIEWMKANVLEIIAPHIYDQK